ncbi:MAG TPA: hypothetical protein VFM93_12095, partial [Candidatus Limnocylindria bacterium]|nr:hypothetical protein [Candidatus Limnocylindria bacterium]
FPIPLLHRAIGFGTFAAAEMRTLDAILGYYAGLGLPARVELAEDLAPARAERLLRRAGFEREEETHRVHVLETDRPPRVPVVAGLRVGHPSPARFGRLVRAGFEADGALGDYFERASAAHVRQQPTRAIPLVATVDGADAGSALLWLTPGVAGLYSGSVLPEFRGRGIQVALISLRVRLGLLRHRRVFTSQTEGDNASAHNLADVGFRPLYDTSYWIRETA